MALAPLLQLRVIVRERDSSGTSKSWIAILLVGFALWLAYGIVTGSVPLIVANSASATTALALLVTAIIYSPKRDADPQTAIQP